MIRLPDEVARQNLAMLRLDLEARAAGYWWLAGDWLELVAFAASPALEPEVGLRFAEATRSVPLSAGTELGIVRAALTNSPAVSRVSGLPDDAGSGSWLRAFDATRSVAVPLHDAGKVVRAVVSVALAGAEDEPEDQAVVTRILAAVRDWTPFV